MRQSKIVFNKELFWEIDTNSAERIQKWVKRLPRIFQREISEMNEFFPRWILTVSKQDGTIITCDNCDNTIIPVNKILTCVACDRTCKKMDKINLAWIGHLPTLVSGRKNVLKKLLNNRNPEYPLVEVDNKFYWLVPLVIVYPDKFPAEEAQCFYKPEFFKILGTPPNSHYNHILGQNRMCLFKYNEWNSISVREILQQRVVNHLISTIKIADGVPYHEAFLAQENRW